MYPLYPESVRLYKMSWMNLPIVDFSTPDEFFESQWSKTLTILQKTLDTDGRVLIHCRGGLGRTGLFVSRLLIEYGWSPDKAILEVRAARPGAIETQEQERYVLLCKPS